MSVAELRRLVRERLSVKPDSRPSAGGPSEAVATGAPNPAADLATIAETAVAERGVAETGVAEPAVVEAADDEDFRTVSFDAPPVENSDGLIWHRRHSCVTGAPG